MAKDDTSAILRLRRITIRPRNDKLDDEARDAVPTGIDDLIFRVDRSDIENRARLSTDRNELAVIRHRR